MIKKIRCARSLIAAGLLLASLAASARDYDLELIVFERFKPTADSAEVWNTNSRSQQKHQKELVKLSNRASQLPALGGVSRLSAVEAALQKSGYRILQATRWQQPSAYFKDAPVYRISSNDGRLDGALRVYKTTLIFADLLLSLKSPEILPLPLATPTIVDQGEQYPTIDSAETDLQRPDFFILEKRNMRFEEVHYFDHPKYGAILAVWPAE